MTQSKEVKGTVNTNKQAVELTALEREVFETIKMCFSNYDKFLALSGKDSDYDKDYFSFDNDKDYYAFLASVSIRQAELLERIVLEVGLVDACLYKKYDSWLKQSRK